jgi:hypothetical protein
MVQHMVSHLSKPGIVRDRLAQVMYHAIIKDVGYRWLLVVGAIVKI